MSSIFGGLITGPQLTVDYYNIKIEDYIEGPPPQDVLDACYVQGDAAQCDNIVRVGGSLVLDGSGVETFTTNLDYIQALENARGPERFFIHVPMQPDRCRPSASQDYPHP